MPASLEDDLQELQDKYVARVDDEFPKGDNGRGKAAVLVGLMMADIHDLKQQWEAEAIDEYIKIQLGWMVPNIKNLTVGEIIATLEGQLKNPQQIEGGE